MNKINFLGLLFGICIMVISVYCWIVNQIEPSVGLEQLNFNAGFVMGVLFVVGFCISMKMIEVK